MTMSQIEGILHTIVESLAGISGLEAIVLGGSRARGTQSADSDIDIGLYYNAGTIDFSLLEMKIKQLDQDHRDPLLAMPGEWGNWVNGGCWLKMADMPVDFILRDVARVQKAVAECREGIVTSHYQTGHPHAYFNAMYMGELAVSQLLWSRSKELVDLKETAEHYPPRLKEALIQLFSFEAGFSQMLAAKNSSRDDTYYVFAHLVRSVSALNQVLFAVNEQYCINEKKAVKMIETFPLRPDSYKVRVDEVYSMAGNDSAAACDQLQALINEVNQLLPQN